MRIVFCLVLVPVLAGVVLAQTAPAKGTYYRAPAGNLKDEVLWVATCEEPAGQGLAFSGQSQTADDGQPHTRIKQDGAWKSIAADLRKTNALRPEYEQVWALRTRLKNATSLARFIYFEGRAETDEKAWLAEKVNPELARLAAELAACTDALPGPRRTRGYDVEQVAFALRHLAAAAPAVRPIAGVTTGEILAALRQAQQALEIAAEAFNAEPPPRVCSPIVYDAATKLYVLFGGDHFDYLTNDVWVFDPVQKKWFQRHPASAPAPRGGHQLTAAGDGTVLMTGGFTYTSSTGYGGDQHIKLGNQYAHLGDGAWTYDIAKNAWTGPTGAAAVPADTRVYRTGAYSPEHFMQGPRPNAAEHEPRLKDLPVNTWTKMPVPQLLFLNRDWGTVAIDTDRDCLLYWSGGHCVHSGSDVPAFHLATGRWELPFPIEMPLGFIGASGIGVGGRNFNGRPWMSNHTWKAYLYDSQLRKLVVAGRNHQEFDHYTYVYEPVLADWTDRYKIVEGMNSKPINLSICSTPAGIVGWTVGKDLLYLMDRATFTWSSLKYEGQLPAPVVDYSGLVYDPKRDRVLFVRTGYGAATKFDGQIFALDMKTRTVKALSPAGMARVGAGLTESILREVVYDPASDLFIWAAWLGDKTQTLAYDPNGNRWVGVKVQGPAPYDVSTGLVHDPKRGLLWLVHGSGRAGEVHVLRFDAAKAAIAPMSESATTRPR